MGKLWLQVDSIFKDFLYYTLCSHQNVVLDILAMYQNKKYICQSLIFSYLWQWIPSTFITKRLAHSVIHKDDIIPYHTFFIQDFPVILLSLLNFRWNHFTKPIIRLWRKFYLRVLSLVEFFFFLSSEALIKCDIMLLAKEFGSF